MARGRESQRQRPAPRLLPRRLTPLFRFSLLRRRLVMALGLLLPRPRWASECSPRRILPPQEPRPALALRFPRPVRASERSPASVTPLLAPLLFFRPRSVLAAALRVPRRLAPLPMLSLPPPAPKARGLLPPRPTFRASGSSLRRRVRLFPSPTAGCSSGRNDRVGGLTFHRRFLPLRRRPFSGPRLRLFRRQCHPAPRRTALDLRQLLRCPALSPHSGSACGGNCRSSRLRRPGVEILSSLPFPFRSLNSSAREARLPRPPRRAWRFSAGS